MERFLRLGWKEYGNMASALARSVARSGIRFDVVVGIARGGVPLAMVISDEIGARLEIVNVKSYNGMRGERVNPRILTTLTSSVEGRRVLLVDDLVEEGDTMKEMASYLEKQRPGKLMTAAMFRKPWSRVVPDFCVKQVDRWVVFPWELGEMRRLKDGIGRRA